MISCDFNWFHFRSGPAVFCFQSKLWCDRIFWKGGGPRPTCFASELCFHRYSKQIQSLGSDAPCCASGKLSWVFCWFVLHVYWARRLCRHFRWQSLWCFVNHCIWGLHNFPTFPWVSTPLFGSLLSVLIDVSHFRRTWKLITSLNASMRCLRCCIAPVSGCMFSL